MISTFPLPAGRPSAATGLAIAILLLLPAPATAQIFGEEEGLAVGLLAHLQDQHGNTAQRVDTQLAFAWGDEVPDPRIGTGPFQATWRGLLLVRASGAYHMHAYLQGEASVEIDGQAMLKDNAAQDGWIDGSANHLDAGLHEIVVTYAKTASRGRFQLFWSGPTFDREPLDPVLLYHETDQADARGAAHFARGQQLVQALRCTACHTIPTAPPTVPAPSLQHLSGRIKTEWLAQWLAGVESETASETAPLRRMPHFALARPEAEAIAELLAGGPAAASAAEGESLGSEKVSGDAARGEIHFVSLGCLACHRLDDLGTDGLFGGGDLTHIADKRPHSFFAEWLKDPKAANPHHRMPRFDLAEDEIADLAQFLSQCRSAVQAPREDAGASSQAPPHVGTEQARGLVARHRCAACHELNLSGERAAAPEPLALSDHSDWENGCTGLPQQSPWRPGYRLSPGEHAAIREYVSAVSRVRAPGRGVERAEDLIARNNCLACHPRGLGKGISDSALTVAERYADTVEHVAGLTPPSLNSIGDKLHDEALRRGIRGAAPVMRPWLSVRMPRFPLSDEQAERLANHFIATDRIASHPASLPGPAAETLPDASLRTVGARLVTSDGFGCTSCHTVGEVAPAAAPLNARGPSLSGLEQRIRGAWFQRWVKDPLRIVPRVEMPAISTAVPGVLDDDLDRQIDAVWQVLNLPDFEPPRPNPVRRVRRHGLPGHAERAAVLTDVLRTEEGQYIKPMLVGLPNRHNVLIDLDACRLEAWWLGDVARQRTEGKVWYWEAAGRDLWRDAEPAAEFTLVRNGRGDPIELLPIRSGQFRTELDQWQHEDGGITFAHRLHFALPEGTESEPTAVLVEQRLRAAESTREGRSGWQRTIRVRGVPAGWQIHFHPLASEASFELARSADGARLRLAGESDLRVQVRSGSGAEIDDHGGVLLPPATGKLAAPEIELEYTTSLPVDRYPLLDPAAEPLPEESLHVVPGFAAVRLPLPPHVMPTGFGWRSDGALFVSDLKGPVWQIVDSNRDGTLDQATQFSDELATPFGVRATDSFVDVINKYGLLRLWDEDADGRADRTEVVASGWGHTADYHDWATGLPTDGHGGYYVALSCQQDERSATAAHLRGSVVRLVPREPTPQAPRRFEVQSISGGHRFPIGIAKNREGDIFVTDNQGNYNPFNELNHVLPGARYGFINANEKRPGFAPPLVPPAIDIPHPWTRSVNGICFLNSPMPDKVSRFGPFEGHLVGCEYDTRRLIRMSLQQVGDTYQGAAYPLSYDQPPSGSPLLGPLSCAVSPSGDLYVGNLRESGWGAGQNTGNLVRLRMQPDRLPTGIAEVRAIAQGFEIEFTRNVSAERAADPQNYVVSSFTRVSTPQYGGEDRDRRRERIVAVRYAAAKRTATVELEPLREGFVYEFHLKDLSDDGAPLFPSEAYYTLRRIPSP